MLAAFAGTAQTPTGFYYARTTGRLTMLANSLGEDRLGSAKLGYIDTAILLKVTDSTKDMYRVQLSNAHAAYVNKYDLRKDTLTRTPSVYLTNSYSVKGDDIYDYVNIALDERLPYKSWMEVNPSKIIVEIYGVQNNTNWITQLKSVQEISDVYFQQVEDDVVRITIDLKHRQHWGYSIFYKNKSLSIRVRRQPASLKVSKLFIAIDPGHGGTNNGASGTGGKALEKNYTLRYANELSKYLRGKGASVVQTRTNDTSMTNMERAILVQNLMPDLLISLHFNSSGNPNVKGVSTYYKSIGFKPLATALLDRMLQT